MMFESASSSSSVGNASTEQVPAATSTTSVVRSSLSTSVMPRDALRSSIAHGGVPGLPVSRSVGSGGSVSGANDGMSKVSGTSVGDAGGADGNEGSGLGVGSGELQAAT